MGSRREGGGGGRDYKVNGKVKVLLFVLLAHFQR